MRMRNILIITMFYGLLFSTSCSINSTQRIKSENNISDKEYQRDCIFIEYTIYKFIENKYKNFDYTIYQGAKAHIDTILYSPDKLKLFSIIIIEEKDTLVRQPFNGQAIIAYRDSLSDIWKIYPISNYSVSWKSYKGASRLIRRCYFVDLIGNKFKYTPVEDKFWDDLFFMKGYDVDSLYYFQTEINIDVPTLKR